MTPDWAASIAAWRREHRALAKSLEKDDEGMGDDSETETTPPLQYRQPLA
jgi:hypothetical protein